jgi:hypothetical protein
MSNPNETNITPGMKKYIDKNNAYLKDRSEYINNTVKKWKFDTIAVHGLYCVKDAIDDYQGSIIEPIFMSTSQVFRDSDEMEAALSYQIPSWTYSRIDSCALGGLRLQRRNFMLLDLFRNVRHHGGRTAVFGPQK